jgi:hypothetical protein
VNEGEGEEAVHDLIMGRDVTELDKRGRAQGEDRCIVMRQESIMINGFLLNNVGFEVIICIRLQSGLVCVFVK